MRGQNTHSVGFARKQVRIRSFSQDGQWASCLDTQGQPLTVSTRTRGKGVLPTIDEIWVVDREFGNWTLVSCVERRKPAIVGDVTNADPLLLSILDALVGIGLVDDLTTGTR